MPKALIGLDLGTTSCKGALLDLELNPLRSAEQGYPLITLSAEKIEQDADHWWEVSKAVLRRLVSGIRHRPGGCAGREHQRARAVLRPGRPSGRSHPEGVQLAGHEGRPAKSRNPGRVRRTHAFLHNRQAGQHRLCSAQAAVVEAGRTGDLLPVPQDPDGHGLHLAQAMRTLASRTTPWPGELFITTSISAAGPGRFWKGSSWTRTSSPGSNGAALLPER